MLIGDGERTERVAIGSVHPPRVPADLESPSEVAFHDLVGTMNAWNERAALPMTEWGQVLVGHAAREFRAHPGPSQPVRTMASVGELGMLPSRIERGDVVSLCGESEPDYRVTLKKPAPPVFDEEGISPDDPFDPVELYAYYLGLHVNTRQRGIHLHYALGMPTGWQAERRTQVMAQFRRGIFRSLPAGMVAFDNLADLTIVDAGPNVLSFAAYAFRVFGIEPRGEPVPFVAIDAGASETSVLCGSFRNGSPDEVGAGYERIVEHVEPVLLPDVAGERLVHGMAYRVYAASASSMRGNDVPFAPPDGEALVPGLETWLVSTPEAHANARVLKDAVRSILENPTPTPLPDSLSLCATDSRVVDARVLIDRAELLQWLRGELDRAAVAIHDAIERGFQQITRAEPPYASMRLLLGGRLSMNPYFQEKLAATLPSIVKTHKFREPDETNLNAPTVKLATAHGMLALRYQPLQPSAVKDDRAAFGWRVGRNKQGKLLMALDESTGYDVWRELGPCTRAEVSVLYVPVADAAPELAADAQGVRSLTCDVGFDAVGYRLYVRAVGASHVELSIGPPGGRPDDGAPTWGLELNQGYVVPVTRR